MLEAGPRHLVAFDTHRLPQHVTDVVVVGTGVAGCSAALAAATGGRRVRLISKGKPEVCNTAWAKGGVAAVLAGTDDRVARHVADTLDVGCGLCDEAVVQGVIAAAAGAIETLVELGAHFDMGPDGRPERGLEGGHSHARVLHARGDATGAEIRDTLSAAVADQPDIESWADTFLVDVLTDSDGICRGVLLFSRGRLRVLWAGAVVLASGGYAQIYRESTNVPGATGDAMLAGWRAGAALRDLEFVQFHPTTLYLAGVPRMLITEAVRGEGAHIVDGRGTRFLFDSDPRGELAPRDLLSRVILSHLQRTESTGVYLDLRHLDAVRMAARFPGVAKSCAAHGLDIGRDLIPIRPAAHYTIGGLEVDRDGSTSVPGLFAVGEAAASGLHGANRLASNSLLEGLVLGPHVGLAASRHAGENGPRPRRIEGLGPAAGGGAIDADDLRASLKALLWREAGVVRSAGRLEGAGAAVTAWEGFARRVGGEDVERWSLLGMLGVARLLVNSALARTESRGTHSRRDHPERNDSRWRVHLVHRREEGMREVPHAAVARGARA